MLELSKVIRAVLEKLEHEPFFCQATFVRMWLSGCSVLTPLTHLPPALVFKCSLSLLPEHRLAL